LLAALLAALLTCGRLLAALLSLAGPGLSAALLALAAGLTLATG
jgi:hypothetical protein